MNGLRLKGWWLINGLRRLKVHESKSVRSVVIFLDKWRDIVSENFIPFQSTAKCTKINAPFFVPRSFAAFSLSLFCARSVWQKLCKPKAVRCKQLEMLCLKVSCLGPERQRRLSERPFIIFFFVAHENTCLLTSHHLIELKQEESRAWFELAMGPFVGKKSHLYLKHHAAKTKQEIFELEKISSEGGFNLSSETLCIFRSLTSPCKD